MYMHIYTYIYTLYNISMGVPSEQQDTLLLQASLVRTVRATMRSGDWNTTTWLSIIVGAVSVKQRLKFRIVNVLFHQ